MDELQGLVVALRRQWLKRLVSSFLFGAHLCWCRQSVFLPRLRRLVKKVGETEFRQRELGRLCLNRIKMVCFVWQSFLFHRGLLGLCCFLLGLRFWRFFDHLSIFNDCHALLLCQRALLSWIKEHWGWPCSSLCFICLDCLSCVVEEGEGIRTCWSVLFWYCNFCGIRYLMSLSVHLKQFSVYPSSLLGFNCPVFVWLYDDIVCIEKVHHCYWLQVHCPSSCLFNDPVDEERVFSLVNLLIFYGFCVLVTCFLFQTLKWEGSHL